jgi:hypothetical protein
MLLIESLLEIAFEFLTQPLFLGLFEFARHRLQGTDDSGLPGHVADQEQPLRPGDDLADFAGLLEGKGDFRHGFAPGVGSAGAFEPADNAALLMPPPSRPLFPDKVERSMKSGLELSIAPPPPNPLAMFPERTLSLMTTAPLLESAPHQEEVEVFPWRRQFEMYRLPALSIDPPPGSELSVNL